MAEESREVETLRRQQHAEVNAHPGTREALQAEHGDVWDTEEMRRDFTVTGFMSPYVVVVRKADNKLGTLTFQGSPRFYFSFAEHGDDT
jgi:hypothetical protein